MATSTTDLLALFDRVERDLQAAFVALLERVRRDIDVDALARLIDQGRFEEALADLESAARAHLGAAIVAAYALAGAAMARDLQSRNDLIRFDPSHDVAARDARTIAIELVGGFVQEQIAAWRTIVSAGNIRAATAREIAEDLLRAIGMNAYQARLLVDYRRAITAPPLAQVDGGPRTARLVLSPRGLARAMDAQAVALLKQRAQAVALAATHRAVNQGESEAVRQAQEANLLDGEVIDEWITRRDPKVRDSHAPMHGQRRPRGVPFVSGFGNLLRYPGDPAAPLREIMGCRCRLRRLVV